MRISDWSSDVCSSDLAYNDGTNEELVGRALSGRRDRAVLATKFGNIRLPDGTRTVNGRPDYVIEACEKSLKRLGVEAIDLFRSEEHTSELQSLMRISYAVFCLKKKIASLSATQAITPIITTKQCDKKQ